MSLKISATKFNKSHNFILFFAVVVMVGMFCITGKTAAASVVKTSNATSTSVTATVQPATVQPATQTPVATSVETVTQAPVVSTVITEVQTVATVSPTASAKSASESIKAKKKTKKAAKKASYTKTELKYMASIINCEAGGESFQGQIAVGIVVMNRVSSKDFPNSVKGVIYQRGQFSPVYNGALNTKLSEYNSGRIHSAQWKSCIKAAKKVLEGQRYVTIHGSKKSLKGYHFFSVYLRGYRFRLGGHKFK